MTRMIQFKCFFTSTNTKKNSQYVIYLLLFHRVDMIFSNWLLMYLSTEEVRALFTRMLGWLKDDGILFFRESCFQQSGK